MFRPVVIEKDMTEVDLSKLLNVPQNERNITMEEIIAAGKTTEEEGLNTAQDDTIVEDENGFLVRFTAKVVVGRHEVGT